MDHMNYQEALDYLNGLIKFGIKFGLDRIAALCEAFDNPHSKLRVIHVGGTNGKGSTAAFIASILQETGYRAGLYLSPYARDVRERIQINGQMISKKDFASLIEEIKPVADEISKTDLGPVTEFEVKTLMAYLHMARNHVDFAVLEVGMGGRFDATNLVQPLVAVITNVGLDHTDRLGDTVEKIAFEKAGIIKTGTTLVTAVDDQRAWDVILDRCIDQGVEVWRVMDSNAPSNGGRSADVQLAFTSERRSFSVRGGEVDVVGLKPGLKGRFQHVNAATAVAAIKVLEKYEVRIPPSAVEAGVANAYLPARMEVLREKPLVVVDGAHNPDAARRLAQAVKESFDYENLILVIGMISGHSPEEVLAHLAPIASTMIATQSTWHKAYPAGRIAEAARGVCENVEELGSVPDAVKRALEIARHDDLVLITGSFYTVGEVPKM